MIVRNSLIKRCSSLLILGLLVAPLLVPPAFSQARVMQEIRYGTVVSVQAGVVRGRPSGVGAGIGGTAGALAGAALARGRGGWISGMLGGVLGGIAGHAIEKASRKKKGVQLIIQLEDGGEIGIQIPGKQAGVYRRGDRVRLMTNPRGKTEVTLVDY